jgi:hypothetical protein
MKERKKERNKCFTPKTLKKCFTKTTRRFRVLEFGTSFASGVFF